uniref:Cystinosin homolog n=1 Tax=Anopheles farauti TaxID=69004 RepID=A0A1Y9H8V3_9DIPT
MSFQPSEKPSEFGIWQVLPVHTVCNHQPKMTRRTYLMALAIVLLCLLAPYRTDAQTSIGATVVLDPQDVTVIVGEREQFIAKVRGMLTQDVRLNFSTEHADLVEVLPTSLVVSPGDGGFIDRVYEIGLKGVSPGQFDLVAQVLPTGIIDVAAAFIRVTVANSQAIIVISNVIGWIYFAAWTVSFWPQMIINYRRQSVVGLSFDFLTLNLVGHSVYATFNCALFWSAYIEQEYLDRNPRGLNPVLANDVAFSIHATIATLLTVAQCFIYERGEQKVSRIAWGIISIFAVVIVVAGILVGTDTFHWLDFLYVLSYIKLSVTLIKYVPQAVLNFRRKSTVGWSIENVLLDFTGGMLSMLQMLMNGYNYDDWASIFGDPTKFGLGLFSVLFDILFIVQHYILYRNRADSKTLQEDSSTTTTTASNGGSKDTTWFVVVFLVVSAFAQTNNTILRLQFGPQDTTIVVGSSKNVTLRLHGPLSAPVTVNFTQTNVTTGNEYVQVTPTKIDFVPPTVNFIDRSERVTLRALRAGIFDLLAHLSPANELIDQGQAFVRVTVAKSWNLITISSVIGWTYFLAWTWSFWPQIWENRTRASVVGLSFDYLALNLLGHTMYAAFNCALFWSGSVQEDYLRRNPRGLIPVLANDVAFSLHATFATGLIIVQCFFYERGQQKVSYTARALMLVFGLVVLISSVLVATGTYLWLDFFYNLSYIKLAVTLVKYIPQAVLNYRRKSTVGWSIGNVLLDFTGGSFSILQMLINGYNYDDWDSIFGDGAKFGLGLFSVLFDVLFIVQHYVLYRNSNYIELRGENYPGPGSVTTAPRQNLPT